MQMCVIQLEQFMINWQVQSNLKYWISIKFLIKAILLCVDVTYNLTSQHLIISTFVLYRIQEEGGSKET